MLDERAEDEKKDAEKDVDNEGPKMFSIGQAETTDDEGYGKVRIPSDLKAAIHLWNLANKISSLNNSPRWYFAGFSSISN